MRLLSFVVSSLLAVGSLAAKKPAADRFETFLAQSQTQNPIKLDDSSYRKLTRAPRDYSISILLTAMDARYGCQLCREFQPEYDLLARSWLKGDKKGDSRLIYAVLDFTDGKDTFMSLGLQTAPVLYFFPATTGPHAVPSPEPIRYDFNNGALTAEQVHGWMSRNLPDRPHPPVKRPINWMRWITGTVSILGVSTAAFLAWPYVVPIITNRNIWAGLTLISILVFTSGHMFNHIRKVPYVAGDGRGGVSYFAGGFQNQYGLETQIIAAIYGILAFASISLAVKVPRIADAKTQQVAVIVWGGVMLAMYSFLLSTFRIKNGGYPFSLPPFF
ncbi:hypothetical protein MCOR27_002111 [Pyricularia oryzae]|uniref:Uncharacterized protein n=4 Tax=Pyricularia TaxID=48558 RepID=A0ABQ8NWX0_PYRGI|nr:dolichyl-diphosphooligosaccharide-protein glycotransferase [Pyricularia oryzae 70-15]ELQ33031.1 dolichyl-diphosphooligosaccharide-protein glycotransferase [Pyricularia oryzae Y34]KAH8844840.1 hypothetical protein MCOR01_002104 [Pyricularia oryzae]KAI6303309.1 hypothetical protein MCOR33_001572 [Pyricularia grisea]EHA58343.1 dolichyl-diphosphooligosaccharide-protein glycotransferase [Pyricularia oryzae 70-15]KAI6263750.1 hypothetical protein MCOR19_000083 [Pyricularia oryzae]